MRFLYKFFNLYWNLYWGGEVVAGGGASESLGGLLAPELEERLWAELQWTGSPCRLLLLEQQFGNLVLINASARHQRVDEAQSPEMLERLIARGRNTVFGSPSGEQRQQFKFSNILVCIRYTHLLIYSSLEQPLTVNKKTH